LTRPSQSRQRTTTHPWPQPLPARWIGAWDGDAQPLPYLPVEPDHVAEISADTAYEHGRWRHPPRYIRLRADISVFDVPPYRTDDPV